MDEDSPSLLETEPAEDEDTHPLQTQLRNAKAELRKIIAQHQQTIDSLSTDIKENEDKQKKLTTEKQRAMEDFDNSLKELADQKAQLEDSSGIAKANKVQAQKDLAAAIASGTAAIDKLAGELRDSISDLKAERGREEDARSTQITTCEEDMKALLDSQGNVRSAIISETNQLKQQKKDAEDQLEKIKGEHGVVTHNPVAEEETPVSEAAPEAEAAGDGDGAGAPKAEPTGDGDGADAPKAEAIGDGDGADAPKAESTGDGDGADAAKAEPTGDGDGADAAKAESTGDGDGADAAKAEPTGDG